MKKKVLLLILCLLLVLSLSVFFVACDGEDGDGTNSGEYFVDIDREQAKKTTENLLGYAYNRTASDENITLLFHITLGSDSGDVDEEYCGEGIIGLVRMIEAEVDDGDYLREIRLCFYDSEQSARAVMDTVPEFVKNGYLTQKGKMIVYESQEGFFESTSNQKIPESVKEEYRYKFVTNAVQKELQSKNSYIEIEECDVLQVINGEIVNFGMLVMPKTGNKMKVYGIFEISENSDGDFNIRGTYTEDSFEEIKTFNNNKYLIQYLNPQTGMYYEEYDSGYMLTEVYFDGTSFTIPTTYNGKPIVAIGSNDNNGLDPYQTFDVLTDVYYEGTMEQWANIYLSTYDKEDWKKVNIHCSDGVIEKTAESNE